jgi:16S rRNA (cytosine967-C5)-methyltransferase
MSIDREHAIWRAHLRTAEQVLAHYEGDEPFPYYLKAFFRENPKFGSRDRRRVGQLCYQFFRLGQALSGQPLQDRILAGHLLSADPSEIHAAGFFLDGQGLAEWTSEQRESTIRRQWPEFELDDVFPALDHLSEGIQPASFVRSHFMQPDLFIRLRPGHMESMRTRLSASGIPHVFETATAVRLHNGTSLEGVGTPDRDFVVQDLASQEIAQAMPSPDMLPSKPIILDLCAGSGGKSLLAYDRYPGSTLHVSDVRPSILKNLETRFKTAGIRRFTMTEEDLTVTANRKNPGHSGDLVIADVPCTGSGTWARTPWEMAIFDPAQIEGYSQLQRSILTNAMRRVSPGGYLLYITCSVFWDENEGQIDFIKSNGNFRLLGSGLISGYARKSDSMYFALFTSAI